MCLGHRSWTNFTKWPISNMSQFRSDSIIWVGLQHLWVHDQNVSWKILGRGLAALHWTALAIMLSKYTALYDKNSLVKGTTKFYLFLRAHLSALISRLGSFSKSSAHWLL